jgi:predicted ester cyclase
MKNAICIWLLLVCLVVPTYSYAETTHNSDKDVIRAFYTILSNKIVDATTLQQDAESVLDVNWKKFPGPKMEQGIVGFANTFAAYHQAIPDMMWIPKRIYKSGNKYTVRSIGTGTPVYDFLGLGADWVQGNSFKIMTIDIHTVRNGKIVHTYHVEDWQRAIAQLKKR